MPRERRAAGGSAAVSDAAVPPVATEFRLLRHDGQQVGQGLLQTGIGHKLVQAVSLRDIQVIGVIAMILATAYIAINILADLAVMFAVPKLRTSA